MGILNLWSALLDLTNTPYTFQNIMMGFFAWQMSLHCFQSCSCLEIQDLKGILESQLIFKLSEANIF